MCNHTNDTWVFVQVNSSGIFKNMPNKLFKRDSQRVAFLLCVGFSV